jgi:hypothetical protein
MVRDLFIGYIPGEWREKVDFSDLRASAWAGCQKNER